jgi:galactokinase
VDTHASHADLTEDYAAIPQEMGQVAAFFGRTVLGEVPFSDFSAAIPALRARCGDRAVLRAYHYYKEDQRVLLQQEALERGDFGQFLRLVRQSGRSSYMYLQNVSNYRDSRNQCVAVLLAAAEELLEGEGACRVHGGGFAGTIQAFVPLPRLAAFRAGMEAVAGRGSCHVLSIRDTGSVLLVS